MKRLVLFAGALAVTSAAVAGDEADLKANGEFRVRYYNDMTPSGIKDAPANKSDTEARTTLGLTLKKSDGVMAHLGLIHGTTFGNANAFGSSGMGTNATDNLLLVNEAYGVWKATDTLSFKVGRQHVNVADGSLFSSDDWNMYPTSHEGLGAAYDTDFAKFGVLLVKQSEKGTATGNPDSDPEQNAVILNGDLKNMPEWAKTVNLTVAQVAKSETTAASGTNSAAGAMNAQLLALAMAGEAAGFHYNFDAVMETGTWAKTAAAETKLSATMFDFSVGYHMNSMMGMKLMAGYHMDSGDDTAGDDKQEQYVPLYYDAHKFAGMMDLFGWGNSSYWHLCATVAPSDDMEAGLSLYGFSKTKENGSVSASGNNRFSFHNSLAAKKDLGMEMDLWAKKKYSSNFSIDAMLGTFMPGAAFKEATVKKEATIMQAMVMGTMSF